MGFRKQLKESSRDSYVLTQMMQDMASSLEKYYEDIDDAIAMMDEDEVYDEYRDDTKETISAIRESFNKFRNVLVIGTDTIDVIIQTQKDHEEGL